MVTCLTGRIALQAACLIGLVIPHFVRRLVGGDYRNIVPFSMFTGAVFIF